MDWTLLFLVVLCILGFSVDKCIRDIRSILERHNAATDIKTLADISRRQCELIESLNAKIDLIEQNLAMFGSSTPFYEKPALKVDMEELTAIASGIADSIGRVENLANQFMDTKL